MSDSLYRDAYADYHICLSETTGRSTAGRTRWYDQCLASPVVLGENDSKPARHLSSPACFAFGTLELPEMKVVPLGQKIVVRRLDAEEKTAGGIVLPDNAREKPKEGRVLSVGDGKLLPDGTRAEPEVREGDRILFGSYAGTEVRVDDADLLIMDADEVLAVMR
jgi:chaperonin GroES